jgi:hypothetical protein
MNCKKRKNNFKVTVDRRQPRIRLLKHFGIPIGLIIIIAVAVGVLLNCGGGKARSPQQADYTKLVGDWVRPDGGYVISISNVEPDGKLQAAYYNPNPINVAQANVSFQNKTVKLFVELRDVGYPGSKYNLVYMPDKDVLQGTYFQAQDQVLYNVLFLRKKLTN